jgi:hypothetical protein
MSDTNKMIELQESEETRNAMDSLQQSNEEILRTIFIVSGDKVRNDNTARISRTIAYFSSLLIKLSKQAEESARENNKMQKRITLLTWAILAISVALLVVGVVQITSPRYHQCTSQDYQNTTQGNLQHIQPESKPITSVPGAHKKTGENANVIHQPPPSEQQGNSTQPNKP